MILDRATLARLREQAGQARQAGHYPQAAHLERQAVELAGTLGLTGERSRALLWEGYSRRQAGEDDLALAVLLQAIQEPATDPADRFSALIAILHLSLERKSARFCRALLEQGRRDLVELRQPWSAPLDFLEGELALRRGDFAAAWDWHERAWRGRQATGPRLTAATHLWAQCRTAFRRHDWAELERIADQLAELRPNSTVEQQLVMRAQWLRWRAQRAATASNINPVAAPVEQAREFLSRERESRDFGARLEALRVAALAGDRDRIDAALRRQPLDPDTFATALGLGDLALGRARAALELPAVDDDYGATLVDARPVLVKADSAPGSAGLREAAGHYQSALPLAEEQDQRLETGWRRATVHQRLTLLDRVGYVRTEGV